MAPEKSLSVQATLEQVRAIAAFVRREGEAAGLAGDALNDLELAVVEAANNIVDHGYAGQSGIIQVSAGSTDEHVFVDLVDDASGFPEPLINSDQSTAALSERGRGLAILRACTDAIEYRRLGGRNHLRLIKVR